MKRFLRLKRALHAVLIVLLLNIVGMTNVYAQMFTVDHLNYTVNYGTNTVTLKGHVDGTSAEGHLTIPTTVTHDGITYTVTMIAREAFKDCIRLTGSLVIPNTITAMGDEVFSGCIGFTGSLTIGDALTAIPEQAFYNCTGFQGTLTIGSAVTIIGDDAFLNCSGFTGSLSIPNSVTEIGGWAFSGCSGFNGRLILPSSMQTIGWGAFSGCSGLTGELILPEFENEGELESEAFRGCSGFTGNLVIPNSIENIGSATFAGCSGFNGTLNLNSVERIYGSAFAGCSGFTGDLILPNSLYKIWGNAFANCSGFNGNLLIPESLAIIEGGVFYNCSGLSSITVCNNNPPEIHDWDDIHAFDGVNKSIPVYVPCNTAPQYQIASYWDEFYNYQETFLNTVHLEVEAHYEGSASIEQMPTSCDSDIAIVKAVPNDGYRFVAWKEWDEDTWEYVEVSIEPVYTFNLIQNTRLYAFFERYYHLEVYAEDPGHCTVSIEQMPTNENPMAFVKAVPAEGYHFVAWKELDAITGEYVQVATEPEYWFYMDYNCILCAFVKSNTGVSEDVGQYVSIYPNPIKDVVKIEAEGMKSVSVFNFIGQLVFESLDDGNEFELDLINHNPGVYLIRVETASGITTKRVLLTK